MTSLRVLLLEDSPVDAELLLYELQREQYEVQAMRVETEAEYLRALESHPDIILADYTLPQFDALQALQRLQERALDIPFIVVTGSTSEEVAVACIKQGAADYLIKDRLNRLGQAVARALEEKKLRDARRDALDALRISEEKFAKAFQLSPDAIVINRLTDGVYLEVNRGFERMSGYTAAEVLGRTVEQVGIWRDKEERRRFAEILHAQGEVINMEAHFVTRSGERLTGLVSARTLVLDGQECVLTLTRDISDRIRAARALAKAHQELESAYDATIEGWSLALELRDRETQGHTQRVTSLALRFGHRLGLSEQELKHLRRGVLLHDIGKMAIPDAILHKPGPLTAEEWQEMKRHPEYAYQMLKNIAYLKPALVVPYCHHELWDGSGYPRGLRGEEIPLLARIFTIVDVWDSLCHDRVYRPGLDAQTVIAYLREQAGKKFDPNLVEVFLEMIEDGLRKGEVTCDGKPSS